MKQQELKQKESEKKPKIYPVFLPNLGCKTRCVYCNQAIMTGETIPNIDKIAEELAFVTHIDEIAYYGGTFTGLKWELMEKLLSIRPDIPKRVSTRPDAIDENIVEFLKKSNVKTIELGIESIDDEVLFHSGRNYSKHDIFRAISLLKDNFEIIAHLMTGLPKDSREKDLESVRLLINEGIRNFRIHPTIVFRNTALEELLEKGLYKPQTLEEATLVVAEMVIIAEGNDGKVIRIGYHIPQSQLKFVVAGPYHPSFGDLVRSRIIRMIVERFEVKHIAYSRRFTSWVKGYGNENLQVKFLELTEEENIFFDGTPLSEMLRKYSATI
ncbi:radical SAM protein [Fervidobacterium sp.]